MTRTCATCPTVLRSTRPESDVYCSVCEVGRVTSGPENRVHRYVPRDEHMARVQARREGILQALTERGPLQAGQIQVILGLRKSTCSDDLRALEKAGLVERPRQGRGVPVKWAVSEAAEWAA